MRDPDPPIITLTYRVAPERREALLQFLRDEAFRFYERHGDLRMHLYESADDPGLLVELVAYDDDAAYERDQARVEGDPEMRAMLARFREQVGGPVEVRRLRPIEP